MGQIMTTIYRRAGPFSKIKIALQTLLFWLLDDPGGNSSRERAKK
jgi:hypothetical protein